VLGVSTQLAVLLEVRAFQFGQFRLSDLCTPELVLIGPFCSEALSGCCPPTFDYFSGASVSACGIGSAFRAEYVAWAVLNLTVTFNLRDTNSFVLTVPTFAGLFR
jgi:hypothetical protein